MRSDGSSWRMLMGWSLCHSSSSLRWCSMVNSKGFWRRCGSVIHNEEEEVEPYFVLNESNMLFYFQKKDTLLGTDESLNTCESYICRTHKRLFWFSHWRLCCVFKELKKHAFQLTVCMCVCYVLAKTRSCSSSSYFPKRTARGRKLLFKGVCMGSHCTLSAALYTTNSWTFFPPLLFACSLSCDCLFYEGCSGVFDTLLFLVDVLQSADHRHFSSSSLLHIEL